jgi:PAS domain-containing protein
MLGTARDITKRKRAERELQKRMNELETFYRATLGREERIIELKQEVNESLEQLGNKKKYGDYN